MIILTQYIPEIPKLVFGKGRSLHVRGQETEIKGAAGRSEHPGYRLKHELLASWLSGPTCVRYRCRKRDQDATFSPKGVELGFLVTKTQAFSVCPCDFLL